VDVFELSFTAAPDDIDELGHVNNAVWVRWIQEMATSHWRAAASLDQVAAYIWVVTRHEIDYLRPLREGETALARTVGRRRAAGRPLRSSRGVHRRGRQAAGQGAHHLGDDRATHRASGTRATGTCRAVHG
jgi:hypothetical protein